MDAIRRNLGTAKQACEIAGVTPGTLRNWLRQNLISAVRVGPRGRYWYDLDSVNAMKVEYGAGAEERIRARIREMVADVPDLTDEQAARIRPLLYAGPVSPP